MKAGAGALSARLRGCRVPVGEVNGEVFMKLMEAWCGTSWSRGVGIWQAIGIDRASTRVFLGVRRPHPEVGLQFEMDMLPLKWKAKKRCMDLAKGFKNVG